MATPPPATCEYLQEQLSALQNQLASVMDNTDLDPTTKQRLIKHIDASIVHIETIMENVGCPKT